MNLPDYRKCIEINQLLVAMGVVEIPELPPLPIDIWTRVKTRERIHKEPDPVDVKFSEELLTDALLTHKADISTSPGGLLENKGRKVCAYIRDQRASICRVGEYSTSNYKYHLCDCQTMRSMRDNNREHRFLTTQKADGFFIAYDLSTRPHTKHERTKLELCHNCTLILQAKGFYFPSFNLEEYFRKYDSYTSKTIRRIETVKSVETYAPDHDEIAIEYKRTVQYKCQSCGVNCIATANQKLIHLHHENANRTDYSHSNLRVLCVDCHSKQTRHGHMLRNPNFKNQIQRIKRLRSSQGLLTVALLT